MGGLADVTTKIGAGVGSAASVAAATPLDLGAWNADSAAFPGVPEWVLPAAGFAAGVATMAIAKPAADEAAMAEVMASVSHPRGLLMPSALRLSGGDWPPPSLAPSL